MRPERPAKSFKLVNTAYWTRDTIGHRVFGPRAKNGVNGFWRINGVFIYES